MEIGQRIKALRESRNLAQYELAKILNIGKSTLSQYENGSRNPSDDMKIAIADYFSVSLDYLMGRDEKKRPAPVSESRPAQPPEYEFLTSVNKAIADRLIADLVKSQPSNVTPIKISAIAQGGQESETEADTVITLPRSSSRVHSAPETAETDGKPSAPEEK